MRLRPLPLALAAASLWAITLALLPAPAHAAESYDNCTGFIDHVPTIISTQGVWCMKENLTTSMSFGAAITIAGNNITIDCNDYKIGGLTAGPTSQTTGIYASARQNATIRSCNLRGFYAGIWLDGSGHLVEDNRIDGSLWTGIRVVGGDSIVQRNRVLDTGGTPAFPTSYGMYGEADFIDNVVETVFGAAADSGAIGVFATADGAVVRGNRIRGLVESGTGMLRGIVAIGEGAVVIGNSLGVDHANTGKGVVASGCDSFCRGNTAYRFGTAYEGCEHKGGNLPVVP